ncbi:MAG: hypothetical protein M3265_09300 [Actinomycetota bacterium]|nr:hypothetical protein [Actinomycetota bacterium]
MSGKSLFRGRRGITLAAGVLAAAGAAVLYAGISHGGHNPPSRPHPIGHNEGFGNFKVTVFFYPQNFFCTDEPFDDLDGPGHNGDGIVAAQDPDEFQEPAVGPPGAPCIVGQTARGSLPTIDPTGRPIQNAEPVWAILPFFDRNRNGVLDVFDPAVTGPASATPVQCPEPGPPFTRHTGIFGTCAMHPSTLHAEPVASSLLAGVSAPGPHIPLPNHSHIVRDSAVSINPVWWQVISVRVDDETIWPDFDGRCPANPRGGEPCLTDLEALRQAQRSGRAGPDVPTNVWLFFDSTEVQPQPGSSSGSG